MTVTTTAVHADVGELWDAIEGTTTTVINNLIERAQEVIASVDGGSSSHDIVVRPLADAFVVRHVMGGLDGVQKSIGPLSVGRKELLQMKESFEKEANNNAMIKGYTLDGISAKFEFAND